MASGMRRQWKINHFEPPTDTGDPPPQRLLEHRDWQWTRGSGGAMVRQDSKSPAGRRNLSVPDWLMAMGE